MIVLGLTGSMGMGKSTTAAMFAAQGAAVYDADAAVHRLYAAGGQGGPRLRSLFPEAVTHDGAVVRATLRDLLKNDPGRVTALERVVFPLVAEDRAAFLSEASREARSLAVLDIPLLFETGGEASVDAVVVVSASPATQLARILARPGMDRASFEMLDARQLPDAEKRRRADFVIDTDRGMAAAAEQVGKIVRRVTASHWSPPRRAVSRAAHGSDIASPDPEESHEIHR